MVEIRRPEDNELCGHVEPDGDHWRALTVFGALLGRHPNEADAVRQVRSDGLASLAAHWTLRNSATGDEELVCIQEANAGGVLVALGYYSMPGVPTQRVTRQEIESGEWEFIR